MKDSQIEWTDHTFNPWIGCTKVSEACRNCYAEAIAKRFYASMVTWGPGQKRWRTADGNWKNPRSWNREAARRQVRYRVFCASLADVFDAEIEARWRTDLWGLIRETPSLDWLMLTKRPENISRMLPSDWGNGWPNVWLGTTAEEQRRADERLPALLAVPAVVHFASCEPLLEPLEIERNLLAGLDWVIAGGESGAGSRKMNVEWVRSLRDQCVRAGACFFFKQWGQFDAEGVRVRGKKNSGRTLDGREWSQVPEPAAVTG